VRGAPALRPRRGICAPICRRALIWSSKRTVTPRRVARAWRLDEHSPLIKLALNPIALIRRCRAARLGGWHGAFSSLALVTLVVSSVGCTNLLG
jgi:hypothetical protein